MKNILALILGLSLSLIAAEVIARVYAATPVGGAFLQSRVPIAGKGETQIDRYTQSLKPHPFFGYVYKDGPGINSFGFMTPYDFELVPDGFCAKPCHEPKVTVGVFGGSLAGYTMTDAKEYLANKLGPLFPGRRIYVVNFAMGGTALPHQLYAFLYFRTAIDIAVFIDGLNEIWNPLLNVAAGEFPDYAKAFHYNMLLGRDAQSPELIEYNFRYLRLSKLLKRLEGAHFQGSMLVQFLASSGANWLKTELSNLETQYLREAASRSRFPTVPSTQMLLGRAVSNWGRDHRLIDEICDFEKIQCFHFLQPNPHIPHTKALSGSERAAMDVDNRSRIRDAVLPGYPMLRKELNKIKGEKSSLKAYDLTLIYASDEGDMWRDDAHPNMEGSRKLLSVVGDLVAKQLDSRDQKAITAPNGDS